MPTSPRRKEAILQSYQLLTFSRAAEPAVRPNPDPDPRDLDLLDQIQEMPLAKRLLLVAQMLGMAFTLEAGLYHEAANGKKARYPCAQLQRCSQMGMPQRKKRGWGGLQKKGRGGGGRGGGVRRSVLASAGKSVFSTTWSWAGDSQLSSRAAETNNELV